MKWKVLISLATFFLLLGCFGVAQAQQIRQISLSEEECYLYTAAKARQDIALGKRQLIVNGGIAAVLHEGDASFQETYKVKFFFFGCVRYESETCMSNYNKVVFEALTKEFGAAWREEIREDVIGLASK